MSTPSPCSGKTHAEVLALPLPGIYPPFVARYMAITKGNGTEFSASPNLSGPLTYRISHPAGIIRSWHQRASVFAGRNITTRASLLTALAIHRPSLTKVRGRSHRIDTPPGQPWLLCLPPGALTDLAHVALHPLPARSPPAGPADDRIRRRQLAYVHLVSLEAQARLGGAPTLGAARAVRKRPRRAAFRNTASTVTASPGIRMTVTGW
jgi:hypothetical protein